MDRWLIGADPESANSGSFCGGNPRLPPELAVPTCTLCGAELTFYFQLAFPLGHAWAGQSIAIFACTACAHEDYLIPEMLSGPLAGASIPAGFLERTQTNFRTVVFPTAAGIERADVAARIRYLPLSVATTVSATPFGQLGGQPEWLLDDEAPKEYVGHGPMLFLFQTAPGLEFERTADAPPQITLALDGTPEPSTESCYQLFLGNAIYFFGTATGVPAVYVLTQVD